MSTGYFISETKQVPYTDKHRYWRVVCTSSKNIDDRFCSFCELRFFSDKVAANQVPNNIALCITDDGKSPSPNGGDIAPAYDEHLNDFPNGDRFYFAHPPFYGFIVRDYSTPNNNTIFANNTWLGQDFGNPVNVQAIGISTDDIYWKEAPTAFYLQWSDDPVNTGWTTLQSYTFADWGPSRNVIFPVTIEETVSEEIFVPTVELRDYLSYIPPLHAKDPYFRAELNFAVENARQLQTVAGLTASIYYDIDSSIGSQLDKVGERIGIFRTLSIPVVHVFFTFGDARRGWGLGLWQHGTVVQTYGLQSFDDETFRRLCKARVIANEGDGSVPTAQLILSTFFGDSDYLYSVVGTDYGASHCDRCSAVMTVGFSGVLPPLIDMIAIAREIIPIRPAGVKLKVVGTTVPGLPCFGFGVDNAFIGGWGRRKQEAFMFGPPGGSPSADPAADALAATLGWGQGYWNGPYLQSYTNRAAWARKPEYLAEQGLVS